MTPAADIARTSSSDSLSQLQGKRVLVTGGSRGIGRGIVTAMARAGAHVLTCSRGPQSAQPPGARNDDDDLRRAPGEHRVIQADVSRPDDVDRLLDECRSHLGGLDVLVNNVGDFAPKPYAALSRSDWDATVAGNLTATHLVTHAALEQLSAGSSIINIGSTVSFVGMAGGVHYTAVKSALVGFTRSLARELGPAGIRVNVVSPGRIETEALAELPAQVAAGQRVFFSSMNALHRLGSVDEVAGVVLFLAGDAAGYITGQNIHVDGCV